MVRRLFPVFVLALFLYAVPAASAKPSPTQTAAHEPGLNTVSGADGPSPDEPDELPQPGDTPEESVAASTRPTASRPSAS